VEIGGVGDDIAECGEGLGLELFVDGLAAGGVDAFDVGDGAPVLVALREAVELGECDVVDFADEDGRHGGVEEVLEQRFGEGGRKRGIRDWGLGISRRWGRPLRADFVGPPPHGARGGTRGRGLR